MTDNSTRVARDTSDALHAFRESLASAPVKKASRTVACFVEAYIDIEEGIQRHVTLKSVRERFNRAYGLNLNAQRFRALLEAERRRRAQLDHPDVTERETAHGSDPSKTENGPQRGEDE